MAPDLNHSPERIRLRWVALFEGAKGLLVLSAGFGLLALLGENLQAAAERIVSLSHLNPASTYPRIFIESAGRISDGTLQWMAVGALAYAALRLVETVGLWRGRTWAAWLGALSGSIYLPIEILELAKGVTLLRFAVFAVNLGIVLSLTTFLWQRRTKSARAGSGPPPAPPA